MKIGKELKYNLLIVAILIILFDFVWDRFMRGGLAKPFSFRELVYTVNFSIAFYTVYSIVYLGLAPRFLSSKKYLVYLLSYIPLIFVFAGLRYLLEEIISFNLFGFHNYDVRNPNLLIVYLVDSAIYSSKAFLYATIIYLVFRYNENKDKIHQLEIDNQQAQLATLKSQISPHFLFNTLNNFYVDLIDDKPETANDILKLSNLMRYVTYETSDDFVPLSNEIDFIKDYLHFYKRRYEDNLQIQFSVNGNIENQQIPTLILIHFIENVCKHGIINDKNRPAKIGINIADDSLEILTENHINTSEKYMETGIGTENIKKRLNVIFEDNYALTNEKNNGIFKSYLKIPMK